MELTPTQAVQAALAAIEAERTMERIPGPVLDAIESAPWLDGMGIEMYDALTALVWFRNKQREARKTALRYYLGSAE